MQSGHVAVVLAVAMLAAATGGAVGASAVTDGAGERDATLGPSVSLQESVDPDDVLLSVDVAADGEAAWTVEYRMRLETDEDEEAFADLQADVRDNTSAYVQRFHDRMNATAATAADATGREMRIVDVTVSAERRELPRAYGVVTYRFRWTSFAAVDGELVTAGDAIDGLFLDEDTTLRVGWPAASELVDASPSPDETRSGAVVWTGPTSFASGEPRVTFGPPGAAGGGTGWPLPGSPLVAGVAVLAVLVVGAVALAVRRRSPATSGLWTGGGWLPVGSAPAGVDDDGEGERGTAGQGGDGGGPASAGDGPEPPADESLLSNEERVLRQVERAGGRMKQKDVAEALEWTDAKTSQVTKRLREAGDLEGYRLGRENVLALPDHRIVGGDETDDDDGSGDGDGGSDVTDDGSGEDGGAGVRGADGGDGGDGGEDG